MNEGLTIQIDPELLNAAIAAMRELQQRYELEAANFASLGEIGRRLAEERVESAGAAGKLFEFFAGI